jgi:predicted nucleic acid-binding protein
MGSHSTPIGLTMADRLIIDTDVAIDYLRDRADAVAYLDNLTNEQLLSVVTVAELYSGVRDGDERTALDAFIGAFEVVPIETAIAVQGGLFRRDYFKSHNVGLADALIAATAVVRQANVVTLNKKHFPMLRQVVVPYKKS